MQGLDLIYTEHLWVFELSVEELVAYAALTTTLLNTIGMNWNTNGT